MTDIYLVETGEYEERYLVGIYSTREAALDAGVEVRIMGLDDAPIESPHWWRTSYFPKVSAENNRGRHWMASTYHEADDRTPEPVWLQWSSLGKMPPEGRVDLDVWATSEAEAIEQAKSELKEATVAINTYSAGDASNPWRKTGEGIPYR